MNKTLSIRQEHFLDFATRYSFVAIVPKEIVKERKFFGITLSKKIEAINEKVEFNDFTFKQTTGGNFQWQCEGEPVPNTKDRLETLVMDFNLKSDFEVQIVNNYIIFV